jgi:hypothetical protein
MANLTKYPVPFYLRLIGICMCHIMAVQHKLPAVVDANQQFMLSWSKILSDHIDVLYGKAVLLTHQFTIDIYSRFPYYPFQIQNSTGISISGTVIVLRYQALPTYSCLR